MFEFSCATVGVRNAVDSNGTTGDAVDLYIHSVRWTRYDALL